jgi:thermitase
MDHARGVVTLIFFLILISGFILSVVCADDATNVTYLTARPGQVHKNSTVTTTVPPVESRAITASITKSSDGREYVSGQVIVRYNSNRFKNVKVMNAYTADSNAKIGARVEKDFSDAGLSGIQVVTLPENLSVDDAIEEYRKNPDVLYAEPNYIYHISAITPDDPLYGYQWGLHNTGTPGADISAPDAWGISTGSNFVVVAVVDTGVDYSHPDLAANIWTNADEIPGNGIDDDGNGYIDDVRGWNFYDGNNDPMDGNTYLNTYHGTHCSGIIGAVGNNGAGVTGVNWNVKIMPLRVVSPTGSLSVANAILAINYADANGANVISNSWGGTGYSQALYDAINSSPAVVVCAAGNYGIFSPELNNDITPIYPASYTCRNIIAVAATDSNDNLAGFSHYGPISVDLAAPGVNILSTNISSANTSSSYQYLSGTSMATPFVAGVAAQVKSVNSCLISKQIKNVILNNVDVKSSLSGKVNTSGRLNAYKAVLAAQWMAEADKIGVFRNGAWYLDYNGNGWWDCPPTDILYPAFGMTGDAPVAGDWNGDGKTEFGVFRNGAWYLDYNGNGWWDGQSTDLLYPAFGIAGDKPAVGDWNHDGTTEIGTMRDGAYDSWYLDYNGNGWWDGQSTDLLYPAFGIAGDKPAVGDWNHDGTTEIGIMRDGAYDSWYLDSNGNGWWDGQSTDILYPAFGISGDAPTAGGW